MSKGGSQQQTQSVDPQIKQAYLDNLAAAKSTAGDLEARQFAGFTPEYQAAQDRLTNLGMTGFTPDSISQFMNPYQEEVIGSAMNDIELQRQRQRVADASSATRAGAFGGSRQGVVEALTNEAALRQGASTAAQMRAQGYGQAAQLAQQAQTMGLQGAGAVMSAQQMQQALEQQRLDAMRNLPLEQLALQQSAMSAQPANLGMTATTPTTRNVGAGALGGAGMAYALGATNPYVLGGAALLGSGLLG
jgi:hypothetical protein